MTFSLNKVSGATRVLGKHVYICMCVCVYVCMYVSLLSLPVTSVFFRRPPPSLLPSPSENIEPSRRERALTLHAHEQPCLFVLRDWKWRRAETKAITWLCRRDYAVGETQKTSRKRLADFRGICSGRRDPTGEDLGRRVRV